MLPADAILVRLEVTSRIPGDSVVHMAWHDGKWWFTRCGASHLLSSPWVEPAWTDARQHRCRVCFTRDQSEH
jgi:hypothetical protein